MSEEEIIETLLTSVAPEKADQKSVRENAVVMEKVRKAINTAIGVIEDAAKKSRNANALRLFMEANGITGKELKKMIPGSRHKQAGRHPIYAKGEDGINAFIGMVDAKIKSGASAKAALDYANKTNGFTGTSIVKPTTLKSLRIKLKKA